MKKTLTAIGAFIATFFGLFTVINMMVVLIFPVSWNDVVTCAPWCAIYFFIGVIMSVMVVDKVITDNP
jgi:hypothetical protein